MVYVEVGDTQQKGIIIFIAEILEASSILSHITEYLLNIINKLRRGTLIYNKFGLVCTILEYIAIKLRSLTILYLIFIN